MIEHLTNFIRSIMSQYVDLVKDLPYPSEIIRDIRNFAYQKGFPIDDRFEALVKSACCSEKSEDYLTGICIPVSRLISVYMESVHGIKVEEWEMCYYHPEQDDIEHQVHRMIKVDNRYYDLFFPEGIEDPSLHPLWQEDQFSDEVFVMVPISNCFDNKFEMSENLSLYKWLCSFIPEDIDPSPIRTLLY